MSKAVLAVGDCSSGMASDKTSMMQETDLG
jgi:hypothetical protein